MTDPGATRGWKSAAAPGTSGRVPATKGQARDSLEAVLWVVGSEEGEFR
jgi:hypothetical protein